MIARLRNWWRAHRARRKETRELNAMMRRIRKRAWEIRKSIGGER